jgi:hypothetical protein
MDTLLAALRTAWTEWLPHPQNDHIEVIGKPMVTVTKMGHSKMLLVNELGQPPRYQPCLCLSTLCKAALAKPSDGRTKLIMQ